MDSGGNKNVEQGLAFEDDVYHQLRRKYPDAKIERQVEQDGLIADIVLTRRSGKKVFIECKCLYKTKLSTSDVKQVEEYRNVMGNPERDEAWLVTPEETERTGNVNEYAEEEDVKIFKLDE